MFQRLIRSWSEPTRSAEIVGIQYLRGFAVIGVVLSHATTVVAFDKYFGGPAAFRGVLGWGGVGVELFYVISGFIIVAVSLRPETLEPRRTIPEFIWRRFARIIPLMWLAVISYSCLHYLGRGSADLSPMLRTLVLWPIGQLEPIPLWSLRQEWLFYLLFSVAMLHTQRRTWVLLAWFISPAIVGLFRSEVDVLQPAYRRGSNGISCAIDALVLMWRETDKAGIQVRVANRFRGRLCRSPRRGRQQALWLA